jgi:hypothetical protein
MPLAMQRSIGRSLYIDCSSHFHLLMIRQTWTSTTSVLHPSIQFNRQFLIVGAYEGPRLQAVTSISEDSLPNPVCRLVSKCTALLEREAAEWTLSPRRLEGKPQGGEYAWMPEVIYQPSIARIGSRNTVVYYSEGDVACQGPNEAYHPGKKTSNRKKGDG